jgi:hypothetical protein
MANWYSGVLKYDLFLASICFNKRFIALGNVVTVIQLWMVSYPNHGCLLKRDKLWRITRMGTTVDLLRIPVIKPLFLHYGNVIALVHAEVGDDNLRIVVEKEGVHLRRVLLGLKDLMVLLWILRWSIILGKMQGQERHDEPIIVIVHHHWDID